MLADYLRNNRVFSISNVSKIYYYCVVIIVQGVLFKP